VCFGQAPWICKFGSWSIICEALFFVAASMTHWNYGNVMGLNVDKQLANDVTGYGK
jgi:hypothetical protein